MAKRSRKRKVAGGGGSRIGGVPIFLISVAASAVSLWTQGLQLAMVPDPQPWSQRLAAAGQAVWFYLGKLLWPDPLRSKVTEHFAVAVPTSMKTIST
jgi:hypothetical protein